jgi:hypothetical protein
VYGVEAKSAGDPTVPKPASMRRRRNRVPKVETVVAEPVREIPPLPDGQDWHPRTVACWETIWRSPIAAIWIDVDVLALERWASLIDLVHWGRDKTYTQQEIRMLEDRFGLSPLARRRLQWEVDQAARRDESLAKPEAAGGGDDRFLRLVSS